MSKKKTTTSERLEERLEALTPLRYYVHEGEKVSHRPQPMAVISDADAREVEDCLALAIAEIRRLEGEAKRWESIAHGFEQHMMRYDDKAIRYREALAVIRHKTDAEANLRDRVGIDHLTPEDACLAEINDIATQALEADHE